MSGVLYILFGRRPSEGKYEATGGGRIKAETKFAG
jgi:hypothetical protein